MKTYTLESAHFVDGKVEVIRVQVREPVASGGFKSSRTYIVTCDTVELVISRSDDGHAIPVGDLPKLMDLFAKASSQLVFR